MRYFLAALLLSTVFAPGALNAQSPSFSLPGDEQVAPGDALEVEIWREQELSGEFVVDEAGIVTLPLLGRVESGGRPAAALLEDLRERYSEELRNPSIRVTHLRRVMVLGEVNLPGPQMVDATVTLAGLLALAGGPSTSGDLDRIRLVRGGEVLFDRLPPGYDLSAVDLRSGDLVIVSERGWFYRHSAFLVSASIGVVSILVTLLR